MMAEISYEILYLLFLLCGGKRRAMQHVLRSNSGVWEEYEIGWKLGRLVSDIHIGDFGTGIERLIEIDTVVTISNPSR